MTRFAFLAVIATAMLVPSAATQSQEVAMASAPPPPPSFVLPSYKGMDYVTPTRDGMAAGCATDWTWLKATCRAAALTRLQTDINYITANNLGKFQRVWISLDQMFSGWNETTGFTSYDSQALASLHTALARFDAAGMRVTLVAFATGNTNHFRHEALDGNHAQMRANYLEALRQFVVSIAGNPVSARTVKVIDLFNEAYYQLETLGFTDAVIHQWLTDMYATAKTAAPNLLYTASDTGRLLTAQSSWIPMYPVDVYDIHVYDDAPWNNVVKYANGLTLPKPWFVGEAGCGSGNVPCTYGTSGGRTQTLQIDKWGLDNLKLYGAKAVLIEDKGTLFIRSHPTYRLRAVGAMVKAY